MTEWAKVKYIARVDWWIIIKIWLTDSKKLTAAKRAKLEIEIKRTAVAWAIAEATIEEIDDLNILHASLLAMRRAVLALKTCPDIVLVDGNREPDLADFEVHAIIKGDLTEPCISAASVLAKEYRDRQMLDLDLLYPQYLFAKHKGYPTQLHRDLLIQHGVSPVHRRSFKPVRDLL